VRQLDAKCPAQLASERERGSYTSETEMAREREQAGKAASEGDGELFSTGR